MPVEVLQKYKYLHCNILTRSIRLKRDNTLNIQMTVIKNHDHFQSTNLINRIFKSSSLISVEEDSNNQFDPKFPFFGVPDLNLELNFRYKEILSWPIIFFLIFPKNQNKIYFAKCKVPLNSQNKKIFIFEHLDYQKNLVSKPKIKLNKPSKKQTNVVDEKSFEKLLDHFFSKNQFHKVQTKCVGYLIIDVKLIHQKAHKNI